MVKGIKHNAKSDAPSTLESLVRNSQGIITVWNGGSDLTIYGNPTVNHAFRAWHDKLHIEHMATFDLVGEGYIAKLQANALGGVYGDIIMAEIVGQAEYFIKNGIFPVDQVSFVKEYLKGLKG
jgi:hypothetical protein